MAEEKTEGERPVEERRFDYPRKEWKLALFCYWLFPLLVIILYLPHMPREFLGTYLFLIGGGLYLPG